MGFPVVPVVLNVVSSIGLVVLNKWLFHSGFNYGTVLLFFHQIMTLLILEGARTAKLFEYKSLEKIKILQLTLSSLMGLSLMNLSLRLNSLGIYQLSKLLVIPVTVVLERIFYGFQYSGGVKASLFLLLVGVGTATIEKLWINPLPLLIALLAVIVTSVSNILAGRLQQELKANPFQTIYEQTPMMVVLTPVIAPWFDNVTSLSDDSFWAFPFTTYIIFLICSTCVLAGLLNISGFFIVGMLSPMTYQVLANIKMIAILTLSKIIFFEQFTTKQMLGIPLSVAGFFLYLRYKVAGTKKTTPLLSLSFSRKHFVVGVLTTLIVCGALFSSMSTSSLASGKSNAGYTSLPAHELSAQQFYQFQVEKEQLYSQLSELTQLNTNQRNNIGTSLDADGNVINDASAFLMNKHDYLPIVSFVVIVTPSNFNTICKVIGSIHYWEPNRSIKVFTSDLTTIQANTINSFKNCEVVVMNNEKVSAQQLQKEVKQQLSTVQHTLLIESLPITTNEIEAIKRSAKHVHISWAILVPYYSVLTTTICKIDKAITTNKVVISSNNLCSNIQQKDTICFNQNDLFTSFNTINNKNLNSFDYYNNNINLNTKTYDLQQLSTNIAKINDHLTILNSKQDEFLDEKNKATISNEDIFQMSTVVAYINSEEQSLLFKQAMLTLRNSPIEHNKQSNFITFANSLSDLTVYHNKHKHNGQLCFTYHSQNTKNGVDVNLQQNNNINDIISTTNPLMKHATFYILSHEEQFQVGSIMPSTAHVDVKYSKIMETILIDDTSIDASNSNNLLFSVHEDAIAQSAYNDGCRYVAQLRPTLDATHYKEAISFVQSMQYQDIELGGCAIHSNNDNDDQIITIVLPSSHFAIVGNFWPSNLNAELNNFYHALVYGERYFEHVNAPKPNAYYHRFDTIANRLMNQFNDNKKSAIKKQLRLLYEEVAIAQYKLMNHFMSINNIFLAKYFEIELAKTKFVLVNLPLYSNQYNHLLHFC